VKRSLTIAVALGLAASARPARAQDAPPIARYVPDGPDRRHVFITDSAHILSAVTIAALQDSAQALQTATGADVAWVTLPTLGGRSIEEATVYLGRTWKIGSAGQPGDPLRNRGLVILYVPDKSTTAGSNFRVEVGKGLQGTIIDSRSRAISNAMRDDLRAKRYDAGYLAGWNAAAAMVREDFASRTPSVTATLPARPAVAAAPPPQAVRNDSGGAKLIAVFVVIGVGAIVLILLFRRTARSGWSSPTMIFIPPTDDATNFTLRRDDDASSPWLGSDAGSDSGSSSDSGGGDFGGGGGFDGGGSSDSI
jgi:uncharacterized protein